MKTFNVDNSNLCVLTTSTDLSKRSVVIIKTLSEESLSIPFIDAESYIHSLNSAYDAITYDVAPYHIFISFSADEINVYKNKHYRHSLNCPGSMSVYDNDIRILILTNSLSDLTMCQLEQIGAAVGKITETECLMLNNLQCTSGDSKCREKILQSAITARNNEVPAFCALEGLSLNLPQNVNFTEDSDGNISFSMTAANFNDGVVAVSDSSKNLVAGVDYITSFDEISKKYVMNFTSTHSENISVKLYSNVAVVINDKLRIIHGIDSDLYRSLVMSKLSISLDNFKRLNPHIYSETSLTPKVSEYLIIPSVLNSFFDYKTLDNLKAGTVAFKEIIMYKQ